MSSHFRCPSCNNQCDKCHGNTGECSGVDHIRGDACQYCPFRLRSARAHISVGSICGAVVGGVIGFLCLVLLLLKLDIVVRDVKVIFCRFCGFK